MTPTSTGFLGPLLEHLRPRGGRGEPRLRGREARPSAGFEIFPEGRFRWSTFQKNIGVDTTEIELRKDLE